MSEEERATRPPSRHRLVHRGTPFDDTHHPRDMRRTTVLEAAAG